MNELRIVSTQSTPEVILTPGGAFKIKGRSIHENITEFYMPVSSWLEDYVRNPADITCVDIELEYFNSSTAKIMVNLFQMISRVHFKHKKLIINWYYEEGDDDVLEKGEYFSSILNMPFNFIRIM